MICRDAGVELVLQTPAAAKGLVTNDLLRRIGLWVTAAEIDKNDADDARDSLRHAVLYLATKHNTLFARLLRATG
jgi:hypothetical protein